MMNDIILRRSRGHQHPVPTGLKTRGFIGCYKHRVPTGHKSWLLRFLQTSSPYGTKIMDFAVSTNILSRWYKVFVANLSL